MIDFNFKATEAAQYERENKWKIAAASWEEAVSFAKNELNKHWASSRFEFCSRMSFYRGKWRFVE